MMVLAYIAHADNSQAHFGHKRKCKGHRENFQRSVYWAWCQGLGKRRQAARSPYASATNEARELQGIDDWLPASYITHMKVLILFVAWCILFVLCWPVALLALILLPVVWLLSLPLRLIGIAMEAVFALVR